NAEGRTAQLDADFNTAETNLARALTRAGDCASAYQAATDQLRRQFNLAFFNRLLLSDEGETQSELAAPFDTILGEELRRAAIAQHEHQQRDAIDEILSKPSARRN